MLLLIQTLSLLLLSLVLPGVVFRALKQRGLRSYGPEGLTRQRAALALCSLWLAQLSALTALALLLLLLAEPSLIVVGVLFWPLLRLCRDAFEAGAQLLLNGAQLTQKIKRAVSSSGIFGAVFSSLSALSAVYWWLQDCVDVGCIVKGIMLYSSLLALLYSLVWLGYGLLLRRSLATQ